MGEGPCQDPNGCNNLPQLYSIIVKDPRYPGSYCECDICKNKMEEGEYVLHCEACKYAICKTCMEKDENLVIKEGTQRNLRDNHVYQLKQIANIDATINGITDSENLQKAIDLSLATDEK